VHSGGEGSVYRVDVLTGEQDTLTRITSGVPTKEVGNVGYGNFLVMYYSVSYTASSIHRYFPNSVRTHEMFYGARPWRYPFNYLRKTYNPYTSPGSPPWYNWKSYIALDEDITNEAGGLHGTNIGYKVDLETACPANPQNAAGEFVASWETSSYISGGDPVSGLLKIKPDTHGVSVVDSSIQLGGAVYPQGMYINRGGQWYYRYLDGEEREVEEVLPPMMNQNYVLPYWTDGIKVYRILG